MNIITNTILIAILLISTVFGGAIIELRVKTATVHDAGCNCNLEVAILSPNVIFAVYGSFLFEGNICRDFVSQIH